MEVLTARGCMLDAITHVLPPEGHVGPSFVVPVLAKKIELDLPDTEIMTLVKVSAILPACRGSAVEVLACRQQTGVDPDPDYHYYLITFH
jgi:hypothetical protein